MKVQVRPGLICNVVLATLTAHPWVIKISLLYGLLNRGEACLMQEQRLAQKKINQSAVTERVTAEPAQ